MDLAKNHLLMLVFSLFPNNPFCWFLKSWVSEFIDSGKAEWCQSSGMFLIASSQGLLYNEHHDKDFRQRIPEQGLSFVFSSVYKVWWWGSLQFQISCDLPAFQPLCSLPCIGQGWLSFSDLDGCRHMSHLKAQCSCKQAGKFLVLCEVEVIF